MAIPKKKDVRFFKDFVNLTGNDISIYDEGGNIITIEPCEISYKNIDITPDIGVIVHNKSQSKSLGIPLENIVIVQSTGIGRDNAIISRLTCLADNRAAILSMLGR